MNDPLVIKTLSKFVAQYEHSQRGNLRRLVSYIPETSFFVDSRHLGVVISRK